MRLKLLAGLLVTIVPVEAHASTWYLVGANTKTATYVDADSLKAKGGKVTGSTIAYHKDPVNDTIFAISVRKEFDCAANSYRTLEYSYYDKANKLINTEASATIDEQKTVKPGSVDESTMNFVCHKKGGLKVEDAYSDAPIRYVAPAQ